MSTAESESLTKERAEAAEQGLVQCIKAGTAYQDFLTPWKDTDPDIPILKQAKAEYAKLK